jgi:hypothetical protein
MNQKYLWLLMGLKNFRLRILALVLVSATLFAVALLVAAPRNIAAAAGEQISVRDNPSSSLHPETYEGMITDTRCGAKHSASIGMTAADCTRVCVHGGEQFALLDGDSVYVLDGDPAALKQLAGQRVRIVGTLNGHKISVETAAAL